MVKVDMVSGSDKLYTVADRLPTLEWCWFFSNEFLVIISCIYYGFVKSVIILNMHVKNNISSDYLEISRAHFLYGECNIHKIYHLEVQ